MNWHIESGKAQTNEYYDVCYLNALGYWPNHNIPEWVRLLCIKYDCSPSDVIIREHAYQKEIEYLREQVDFCLDNQHPV